MFKISNFGKALIFSILAILATGSAESAFAAISPVTKKHAHRHRVSSKHHLKQHKHVKKVAHRGKVIKTAKLQQDENQVRQEERAMTALNGGDIAQPAPQAINQQGNTPTVQSGK